MTVQAGQQTIAIHILRNVYIYIYVYLAMKFGQLIAYKNRNFFFINHTQNEARRLVPDQVTQPTNYVNPT